MLRMILLCDKYVKLCVIPPSPSSKKITLLYKKHVPIEGKVAHELRKFLGLI